MAQAEANYFALRMMADGADPATTFTPALITALQKAMGKAWTALKKQQEPPWFLLHMACSMDDPIFAHQLAQAILWEHGAHPEVQALAQELIAHLERVNEDLLAENQAMLEDLGIDPEALWAAKLHEDEKRRAQSEALGLPPLIDGRLPGDD